MTGHGCRPVGQRGLVQGIAEHLHSFSRSFRWELRAIETPAERAALISAMGWCSGWQSCLLLRMTG